MFLFDSAQINVEQRNLIVIGTDIASRHAFNEPLDEPWNTFINALRWRLFYKNFHSQ